MSAYNRVIQRFLDGHDLTASDFNASIDDLKYWVLRQIAGLAPAPSGSGHVLARQGGAILSRDGSFLTLR